MLYYLLFWTILGFIFHFYIISGTNLLTGGPAQNCCFFAYFSVSEKQNIKRNETFGNVIFSSDKIQETWTLCQESHEGKGCAPLPREPLEAPPTCFFLLYIPTYPQTIGDGAKNLIPPPQLSVSTRSHLGACSGAPPEGASITEGFYINTIASPMMCG